MKKTIVFYILFIGTMGFAQQPTTTIDSIPKFNFSILKDIPKSNDYSFQNFNYSTKTIFSVYNPLTGFNDNYVNGSDSFPIHSTMSKPNIWTGEKIDSFNPSGATNIGTALVFGVLNSILSLK